MKYKFIYIIVFFYCVSLNAQQFNFQNYSLAEGLAQSQVYAMLEDSRGYIWMGTQGGGLCQFDGRTFQTFTVRDSLPDNVVESIFEDSKGILWIGTQNGFCTYDGLKFRSQQIKGEENISVFCFYEDGLGRMWIGSDRGVFIKEKNNYIKEDRISRIRINAFFEDSKKNIWVGSNDGAFKIYKNKIKQYRIRDGMNSEVVVDFEEEDNGNIWMCTYGGGVNILSNNRFYYLMEEQGLQVNLLFCTHKDKSGNIWIGGQRNGFSIWNPKDSTFSYLNERDGMTNNHIRCMVEDQWGNIWIGTSGGGVSKYSGQLFVHYDKSNRLKENYVYAICEDRSGDMWISAYNKGVSMFNDSTFSHYGIDSGFLDIKSKMIFEDSRGRMWLGTEGRGLALMEEDTIRYYTNAKGLSDNWIRDMVEDTLGNFWIGVAGGGVTKMTPVNEAATEFNYKIYVKNNGFPDDRINALLLDREQRLWFATRDNGMGYFKTDSTFTNITKQDGMPDDFVRSIVQDSLGFIWVGTRNGIGRLFLNKDSIDIIKISSKDRLTSGNIYSLILDDDQNLWAGSEVGVDKIELDASRQVKSIKHYGKSEGFIGIETCQNSVWKDRKGHLWFGTINGLTKYNPENRKSNPTPPVLHFTDIKLFYKSLSRSTYADWVTPWNGLKKGLSFPYHQNHLGFEFLGVNHSNPEKVRYQWKLKGAEQDWSPISQKTDVTYSNLSPGKYTFQVQAFNEDGIGSKEPLALSFSIRSPFWATWWFRLLVLGVGGILIYSIFKSRVNAVRRKAALEQERLTFEKNLLELEQKALQLQMNPHFIFNALNSIQALTTKEPKKARYQLAKFSKLMRSILENSREPKITLEQERETLENYLALEKFSRNNSFDYTINIDENLDSEEVLLPPMMIQPFVENAIIHGVAQKMEDGIIEISFIEKNNLLECIVQDNGVGRAEARERKSQQEHTHKSMALQVTQERLEILNEGQGGKRLEIIDMKNSDGDSEGTKVILSLPLL